MGILRIGRIGLLLLLGWALVVSGCTKEGAVRVTNGTDYPLTVSIMEGPDEVVPAGGELVETVKLSKGFFPPSEREIEVAGSGAVKNPFSVRIVVADGSEETVSVEPDAAGLVVINGLECSLREVYIKGCDAGQWGGNRLENPVRPQGTRTFRLGPGCYDIRLKSAACPDDPFSRIYEGLTFEIGRADTITFTLTGEG